MFQWRDKNLRKFFTEFQFLGKLMFSVVLAKITNSHILLLEIGVVFFTQPNYYILMKVYTYILKVDFKIALL